MSADITTWAQAGGALIVILLLLFLAARALRMSGLAPRGGRRLSVQEILPLDARQRLLLVRCDGRDALLLTGGGQNTLLGWLPESPQS